MRKFKNRSRKLARQSYWERYDRDSYQCPDCGRGEPEIPGRFEVHHQNGEPMDNRPENHVALCRLCHNLREGKKPNIENIRALRESLTSDQVAPQETSHRNRPISTPETYSGRWGIVRCPGCTEKLGTVSEAVSGQFTNSCCGLDLSYTPVPSVAVVDDRLGVHVDCSQSGLKAWMLGEWVRWLAENHTVEIESPTQRRIGDDGSPIIELESVETPIAGLRLEDMKIAAEHWGWEQIAYTIEKVKEWNNHKWNDHPSDQIAEHLKTSLSQNHCLEPESVDTDDQSPNL